MCHSVPHRAASAGSAVLKTKRSSRAIASTDKYVSTSWPVLYNPSPSQIIISARRSSFHRPTHIDVWGSYYWDIWQRLFFEILHGEEVQITTRGQVKAFWRLKKREKVFKSMPTTKITQRKSSWSAIISLVTLIISAISETHFLLGEISGLDQKPPICHFRRDWRKIA